MGKSHRLKRFAQKKDFLVRFISTFLASLGFPSLLLTFLGRHLSIALTVAFVITASLLSIGINWRYLKNSYLPVLDILAGSLEEPQHTYLRCPSSYNLAEEAKLLASECYSADKHSITPEIFTLLWVKNPYILACLTSDRGDFLGYFDIIPLKNSFAQSLLEGIVTENQITPDHVIPPDEMSSCEYLFISGLAVWDAETYLGRRNASMLVWGLLNYLKNYYGSTEAITFAIASTNQGEELMRRFRLPVACEPACRIDKYPLYAIRMVQDEVTKRLACLPDWGPLCTLEWSMEKRTAKKPSQKSRRPALPRKKAYNLPNAAAPRVAS